MDQKDIAAKIRQAIWEAKEENALAIAAIDLVEAALWEEFHMTIQFGDEQTFRVIPDADSNNKYSPLDERVVKKDLIAPAVLGKHIELTFPNFHGDNERHKYEAVTRVGSAKEVARWITMFRALATAKATNYAGVDGVSFNGSNKIEYTASDGNPREFLNTNGFHVNFSLLFDKEHMFEDRNILMHAVHGVKRLSEESTLLTAMYPDDYERYKKSGSYKANYVGITEKKGDRSLRIVDEGKFRPDKKRVEDRMPSSSVNPYYAHLKILLGIYLGLKGNVKLVAGDEKPVLQVNPADYGYLNGTKPSENSMHFLRGLFAKPKDVVQDPPPLHPIPKSIDAAIEEFDKGRLFRDTLNKISLDHGDKSLIGDQLHEQVLQRVEENIHVQQPVLSR